MFTPVRIRKTKKYNTIQITCIRSPTAITDLLANGNFAQSGKISHNLLWIWYIISALTRLISSIMINFKSAKAVRNSASFLSPRGKCLFPNFKSKAEFRVIPPKTYIIIKNY